MGRESVYNLLGTVPEAELALKRPPVLERITIRYNDFYPNGHANNGAYLESFEEISFAH